VTEYTKLEKDGMVIFKPKKTEDEKKRLKIPKRNKKPVEVKVTIVGKGANTHRTFLDNNPIETEKISIGDTEYTIDTSAFFIRRSHFLNFPKKIYNKLKGIKHSVAIYFIENTPKPISFATKLPDKVISARTLRVAQKSGTLKSALREMFSKPFLGGIGFRQVLFICIVIGVGITVYWMWSQGQLAGLIGGRI